MSREADDMAHKAKMEAVKAIIYRQSRNYPTPRTPPIPDEMLQFVTGRVVPRRPT